VKKGLVLAGAAAVAAAVAVPRLFPEWAKVLARLAKPAAEALKPVTGAVRTARSSVRADAVGDRLSVPGPGATGT
jgi:hypothetical protein